MERTVIARKCSQCRQEGCNKNKATCPLRRGGPVISVQAIIDGYLDDRNIIRLGPSPIRRVRLCALCRREGCCRTNPMCPVKIEIERHKRQYDNGFVIIGNDHETFGNTEGAGDLPYRYRNKIPSGLRYGPMLQEMIDLYNNSDDEYDKELALNFFGAVEGEHNEAFNNVKAFYRENDLF